MKIGEIVAARTNAEFLNKTFLKKIGKNYKQYYKCGYSLSNDLVVWLIKFGGKKSNSGWLNKMADKDTITEAFKGKEKDKVANS